MKLASIMNNLSKVKNYTLLARRMEVKSGYLWLYHNGFAHYMPVTIQMDTIASISECDYKLYKKEA